MSKQTLLVNDVNKQDGTLMNDLMVSGKSVMLDGKRIAPEDYYIQPDAITTLKDIMMFCATCRNNRLVSEFTHDEYVNTGNRRHVRARCNYCKAKEIKPVKRGY